MGRLWDYFMRRKALLLGLVLAFVLSSILTCRLFVSMISSESIEVPRTGNLETTTLPETPPLLSANVEVSSNLGGGTNSDRLDFSTDQGSFSASAPILSDVSAGPSNAHHIFNLILTATLTAVTFALIAKFIFDRFVH